MSNTDRKTPVNLATVAPMDIYSKKGAEVVYTGLNGYDYQKKRAAEFLVVGQTYTVQATEVGQSSSAVKLQGIDASFNTVHFICAGKYQELMATPEDPFGSPAKENASSAERVASLKAAIAKMEAELEELEGNEVKLSA